MVPENNNEKRLKESFHLSEILFALSGVVILLGAVAVYHMQDFPLWLWIIPKAFYLAALLLFVRYS